MARSGSAAAAPDAPIRSRALQADEAAIRAARRAQTEALARGDLDAVAIHWTPDVTIRRALGHAVVGAVDARQVLEPAASAGSAPALVYQRQAVTVQVSNCWSLAWEEGRWTGHVARADTAPVMGGRYAAQWVRRDGRWLIRSELFVALEAEGPGRLIDALP